MRNIFDQYSSSENRVTHALMTALHRDRALLQVFLKDVAKTSPNCSANGIVISVQKLPGKPAQLAEEEDTERRGIPDAWLTDGDAWCLMIENKVLMRVDAGQLAAHRRRAERLGFEHPQLLILTVQPYQLPPQSGDHVLAWSEVYQFLANHAAASVWAACAAEYLEVLEAKLIDQGQLTSGTLTAFNGFPFEDGRGFTYLEGKRLLRLTMVELRKRRDLVRDLGIAADLPGRSAIKDDAEAVWDVLRLETSRQFNDFNEWPHLTFGVRPDTLEAMVTIPHKARGRLQSVDRDTFERLVRKALGQMQPMLVHCPGAQPRMRAQQRHWSARSAPAVLDAVIDFDLRVLDGGEKVKAQPQWLEAAFGAFTNKKANVELQIGAFFPYRTCPVVRTTAVLDRIADVWLACRPLLDVLTLERPSPAGASRRAPA